jgi:hypothetical protein
LIDSSKKEFDMVSQWGIAKDGHGADIFSHLKDGMYMYYLKILSIVAQGSCGGPLRDKFPLPLRVVFFAPRLWERIHLQLALYSNAFLLIQ